MTHTASAPARIANKARSRAGSAGRKAGLLRGKPTLSKPSGLRLLLRRGPSLDRQISDGSIMRRALFAAALVAASPGFAASKLPVSKVSKVPVSKVAVSKHEFVALALDEVHTLTFRAPVATVYAGNPTIADV